MGLKTDSTNPTESEGKYSNLDGMSVSGLANAMHEVDYDVLKAVGLAKPKVIEFITEIIKRMSRGGRLFYLGAGTSGRLGVLDASECPPTFGVEQGKVVGIIAGGDSAIRIAVEGAEDDYSQGWKDLQEFNLNKNDTIVGIASSGRTPYVIGAVKEAKKQGLLTGCITCNPGSKLSKEVDFVMEAITGPEFITGSTRLKAGTATKLILNMITTILFIKLGHVKGSQMVDMKLSNEKLIERGTKMVKASTGLNEIEAKALLLKHKSVREAIISYETQR
ncbi:MAG TPA: N-acetylmuramic acid 6-phosphate etherase [Flavobacteriales bacterium]|nr:N-acetylmuramic acid 6-phosphate etherase [Flavobacteriales bacterium]